VLILTSYFIPETTCLVALTTECLTTLNSLCRLALNFSISWSSPANNSLLAKISSMVISCFPPARCSNFLKHFMLVTSFFSGDSHERAHTETTQSKVCFPAFAGHSSIVFPSFSLTFLHSDSTVLILTSYFIPETTCLVALTTECLTTLNSLCRLALNFSISWSSPANNSLLAKISSMVISCFPPARCSNFLKHFMLVTSFFSGDSHERDHTETRQSKVCFPALAGHSSIVFPSFSLTFLHSDSTVFILI